MSLDTTGIDTVTATATLASLDVRTADQWCVCVCKDDRHRELVVDDVWRDGHHTARECWRSDRSIAERDLSLVMAEQKHIVVRPQRVVTAPVEVVEP